MKQLDIEENAQLSCPIVHLDEENEQGNPDEESKG